VKFALILILTAYFPVVEKVKKRELKYKKRWGKGAESEAAGYYLGTYIEHFE
jgi:hypothetical protein